MSFYPAALSNHLSIHTNVHLESQNLKNVIRAKKSSGYPLPQLHFTDKENKRLRYVYIPKHWRPSHVSISVLGLPKNTENCSK